MWKISEFQIRWQAFDENLPYPQYPAATRIFYGERFACEARFAKFYAHAEYQAGIVVEMCAVVVGQL